MDSKSFRSFDVNYNYLQLQFYIHKIVPSLNNQNSSCPLNILN